MQTSVTRVTVLVVIAAAVACMRPVVAGAESSDKSTHSSHSHQPGYHRRFTGAEKWVKKFDDPARDKWQKPAEVIKALNIQPQDIVADIGAGTGYFSLRIAREYPSATVYAADVETDMVDYLKQQTRKRGLSNHVPVKVGANKLVLPAKLNLVLVVDTYHHIDDRIQYFAALRKQLLPDGRIAIIDFTEASPEGPPAKHRMSKAHLQDEMRQAGYSVDQDLSLLPYQYLVIFKAR